MFVMFLFIYIFIGCYKLQMFKKFQEKDPYSRAVIGQNILYKKLTLLLCIYLIINLPRDLNN